MKGLYFDDLDNECYKCVKHLNKLNWLVKTKLIIA